MINTAIFLFKESIQLHKRFKLLCKSVTQRLHSVTGILIPLRRWLGNRLFLIILASSDPPKEQRLTGLNAIIFILVTHTAVHIKSQKCGFSSALETKPLDKW